MIVLYHQIEIIIGFSCRQIEISNFLFIDNKKNLPIKLNEAIGIKFVYDEVLKKFNIGPLFKKWMSGLKKVLKEKIPTLFMNS